MDIVRKIGKSCARAIPIFTHLHNLFMSPANEVPPHDDFFWKWHSSQKHELRTRAGSDL